MSDQANAVAPEDAMLQFLGGDDDDQQQDDQQNGAQDDQQDDQQDSQDDQADSQDDQQADSTQAEEYLDLTYNGEQLKKTKAEVLELAQKGFDYTQKTQQLADQRKQVEAAVAAAKQQMELHSAITDTLAEAKAIERQLADYEKIDWDYFMQHEPVRYMQLDRQFRQLQAERQQKYAEANHKAGQFQAAHQAQQQEVLAREYQALLNAVPEWRDTAKYMAEREQVGAFARSTYNLTEEEFAIVNSNHKGVLMARDAMAYRQLMAKKPEVQNKVAAAPKPVKPGAQPQRNPKAEQYAQMRERAKKSGRTEDAAAAIERLL